MENVDHLEVNLKESVPFNETASRSRDSEDDREQIDLQEDASLDEVRSDMEEPERYNRRMRNRLHIMKHRVQQHGGVFVHHGPTARP